MFDSEYLTIHTIPGSLTKLCVAGGLLRCGPEETEESRPRLTGGPSEPVSRAADSGEWSDSG